MSAYTMLRGLIKKAVDERRGVQLSDRTTLLLNDLLDEREVLEQKAVVWEYLTWKLGKLSKDRAALEERLTEAGETKRWYSVGVYSEDYRKLADEISEIRSVLAVDRRDFDRGE